MAAMLWCDCLWIKPGESDLLFMVHENVISRAELREPYCGIMIPQAKNGRRFPLRRQECPGPGCQRQNRVFGDMVTLR